MDGLTAPHLPEDDRVLHEILDTPTARAAATVAFSGARTTRPVIRALARSLRTGHPGQPVDLFPLTLVLAFAERLDPDRIASCLDAIDSNAYVRVPLDATQRDQLACATAATGSRRLVRLARSLASDDAARTDLVADILPLLASLDPLPDVDAATPTQLHRGLCRVWAERYGRRRPLGGAQAALAQLNGRPLGDGTQLVVPRTVVEFEQATRSLNNCLWSYPPLVNRSAAAEGILLIARGSSIIAAASVTDRDVRTILGPGNADVGLDMCRRIVEAVLEGAGPRAGPQAWYPEHRHLRQPCLWDSDGVGQAPT